ncbi:hypothetical protein D7I41_12715 [Ochrobactrum sp. MH181795]|nr:hypothetical protein DNK03_14035 [Brucella anthropi]RNL44627.1 hypothetical protein D7I41_12715 [Ochrobactrum sp. MH181795]
MRSGVAAFIFPGFQFSLIRLRQALGANCQKHVQHLHRNMAPVAEYLTKVFGGFQAGLWFFAPLQRISGALHEIAERREIFGAKVG